MAEGIFFSWASSDTTVVDRLLVRLKAMGLNPPPGIEVPRLWEYRDEMTVGDQIPDQVLEAIDTAKVAILCLSDAAILKHQWITTEIAWCFAAHKRGSLARIIPVKVGPITSVGLQKVESLVARPQDYFPDVSTGSEDDLLKLCKGIFKVVGPKKLPQVLPVAAISMTAEEAQRQFTDWTKLVAEGDAAPLWRITAAVGMQNPPEVFSTLQQRYGVRAEDMMPFDDRTVADIVHGTIAEANDRRARRGQRPVFPRWVHGELTGDDQQARDAAIDLWSNNESLLIIDSLSVFNDDVKARFDSIPTAPDESRVTTVCLPPYSRLTAPLDAALRDLVGRKPARKLFSYYRDWTQAATERLVTFDVSTPVALQSWLRRKITTIVSEDGPSRTAVEAAGKSSFEGPPGF